MPLRFRYLLTTVALYVLTCHVRRASASQLGMGDRSSDFSQGANPVARGQEETPRSVGGRGYVQLCWAITSPALFGSTSSEPRQAMACQRAETWEFWPCLSRANRDTLPPGSSGNPGH
jgi:hypothetical protein